MPRLMSDSLREQLAKRIGVYDVVQANNGDWGSVSARQCGLLVKAAIEAAEEQLKEGR